MLERDLAFDPSLSKLALPNDDRLFLSLPLFNGNEWLEPELSHLIYRKHFHPIFTSFERNAITYDDAMFERFARLPKTVFALDANYIFSLHATPKLAHMLQTGSSILPCISNQMSDYVAIFEGYRSLKSRLGATSYRAFCNSIRETSIDVRRSFMVSEHS